MNLDKLKQRREKLASQIKLIDAQLAKAERAQREAEQRDLVKLIQSRGISAAQLSQLLAASGTTSAVPGAAGDDE